MRPGVIAKLKEAEGETLVIPCPKCLRAVIHRFVVTTTVTDEGVAEFAVAWKPDPHICPRPKNQAPPKATVVSFIGANRLSDEYKAA